jgi:hypothetical protein
MSANKTKSGQELKDKIQELKLRRLRSSQATLRRGNDVVPSKKSVKYSGRVTVPQLEQNLRGVPGNSRNKYTSMVQEINAKHTGTVVRKDAIGVLRSARNANTTQGSYIKTVVQDEDGNVSSDSQGRKVFGR